MAEPAEPADPASDVIEKLLAEKQNPPAPQPEAVSDAATTDKVAPIDPLSSEAVIDGVASEAQTQREKRARDASSLLQQAKSAEHAGRKSDALRLAIAAQKLDPENDQIVTYVALLRKQSRVEPSKYGKATAHLAAGLARGRLLLQEGRYADGEDLLEGVVRAADLFPREANVSMYRRLALKELDAYRARVDAGMIQPDQRIATGESDEPILVATGSAAPENARRILRTLETQTPSWYSQAKTKLSFRMTVNYPETSAALVFEDIGKQTGVAIVLDDPVVRARTHLNSKVDLRVGDVPAETILSLACLKSGLEYVITERAVVITTPARAIRYVQDLSDALRDNWFASRVVFPELTPELLASPPLPSAAPGPLADRGASDSDVASYLLSGEALVKDVQSLLR